jgi:hypothetical protein
MDGEYTTQICFLHVDDVDVSENRVYPCVPGASVTH